MKMLFKRDDDSAIIDDATTELAEYVGAILADSTLDRAAALAECFASFGDYLKSNIRGTMAKAIPPRTEQPGDADNPRVKNDEYKLSDRLWELVAAMVEARPGLHPQRAARWLLHTEQGQALLNSTGTHKAERNTMNRSEEMQVMRGFVKGGGMVAVAKRILETGSTSLSEREYTTLVQEDARLKSISFEKAFADPNTQRAYKIVREAGYVKALDYPNLVSVTPVSVAVGNTNEDGEADALKAAKQIAALVEEQRALAPTKTTSELYEAVYANAENKPLLRRAHKRPNTDSTSGDELQGEGRW